MKFPQSRMRVLYVVQYENGFEHFNWRKLSASERHELDKREIKYRELKYELVKS